MGLAGHKARQMIGGPKALARLCRTWARPLLVAAAVPLLLFPLGPLPLLGLALLASSVLAGRYATGAWLARTPLDRPIAIILLMTLLSLYPSVDMALSAPKFYGIVLGFSIYYVTVTSVTCWRHFWFGVALLVAGLMMISFIGIVGADWKGAKYPVMARAYAFMPRLITAIQTSVGPASGIHPAELAGTVAFLLPVPLALLLRAPLSFPQRLVLLLSLSAGIVVLVLSASRAGLAGMGASAFALLLWQWRRIGLGLLSLGAAGTAAVLVLNAGDLSAVLQQLESISVVARYSTMLGRMTVWSHALTLVGFFPYTGIGLNTLPMVTDGFFLPGPDPRVPHAHNVFLQSAVDLGLGGLLGFVGLWAGIAAVGLRACRQAGPVRPWLGRPAEAGHLEEQGPAGHPAAPGAAGAAAVQPAIAGLLAGLIAFLVFGLTDAITLGAKPVVLLWLMFGLIVAARRLTETRDSNHEVADAGPASTSPRWSYRNQRPSRPASLEPPGALHRFLHAAGELYWAAAYVLVALGYLVAGLGIAGWRP